MKLWLRCTALGCVLALADDCAKNMRLEVFILQDVNDYMEPLLEKASRTLLSFGNLLSAQPYPNVRTGVAMMGPKQIPQSGDTPSHGQCCFRPGSPLSANWLFAESHLSDLSLLCRPQKAMPENPFDAMLYSMYSYAEFSPHLPGGLGEPVRILLMVTARGGWYAEEDYPYANPDIARGINCDPEEGYPSLLQVEEGLIENDVLPIALVQNPTWTNWWDGMFTYLKVVPRERSWVVDLDAADAPRQLIHAIASLACKNFKPGPTVPPSSSSTTRTNAPEEPESTPLPPTPTETTASGTETTGPGYSPVPGGSIVIAAALGTLALLGAGGAVYSATAGGTSAYPHTTDRGDEEDITSNEEDIRSEDDEEP